MIDSRTRVDNTGTPDARPGINNDTSAEYRSVTDGRRRADNCALMNHSSQPEAAGLDFFAKATEDPWITALEPHNPSAAPRLNRDQPRDFFLGQVMLTAAFANVDLLHARGNVTEKIRTHEDVMDADIALPDGL